MANNPMFEDWKHSHGKTVSTEIQAVPGRTATLLPTETRAEQPTLSAQEVQNAVNQNAAGNAATALPGAAGLSVTGMGQTGGRSTIIPGSGPAYTNVYSPAMESIMNDLLNAKPFSYDVNADGLYQQIKDNYVKQGRQAMMNTQGQSAALTGGYGNSYGVTAGQQAYQESLGNLSGMIPELQQLAFQQYQQGQDDKRNNLEALNKLEAQEYARWLDEQQLRLELYKQFPELMTMGGGGGGGIVVQGGGASAKDIATELARQGMTTANGYDAAKISQLVDAHKAGYLSDAMIKQGASSDNYVNGYSKKDMEGAALALGLIPMPTTGGMPTVGLKLAGTKAVTGTNGAGNNNAVFTSNANNAKLNEGLNTNKKTYNGLFSFGKK